MDSDTRRTDRKDPLHLLFLCPLPYVASMAFVMESIAGFAERGHRVDVLVSDATSPPFECGHPNVRTFTFRDASVRRGMQYIQFCKEAHKLAKKGSPDLTVGLSQAGLIVAASIKRRLSIPYVFYNDEIWFGNERHSLMGNLFGHTMKFLERRANRKALFTVTQDAQRGRFLSEVNRISTDSMRYLPNSRRGGARISESTYMHERFGFSPDTKIVLWMGAVSPGDGALELAREAADWPKDYRMVFHFRTEHPTPYMRTIMACHDKGQTYVSDKPIPYAQVDSLVASAAVGLGFYADKGINARYIGFSSGKVNAFLKSGVPCVVRDFEGLRWVEEYGAGVCVEDTSGVLEATQRIAQDYAAFQEKAIQTFESLLSFDKGFEPIAEEMEQAVG